MNGKSCIVWLDDCVGNCMNEKSRRLVSAGSTREHSEQVKQRTLWWRNNGESSHHSIGELCKINSISNCLDYTCRTWIVFNAPSRILEMSNVPIPAPVPPPREWVIWKPCRQSHPSASFRTLYITKETKRQQMFSSALLPHICRGECTYTSRTLSTSSAPSV